MITITVDDSLSKQAYSLADKLLSIETNAVNRTAFAIRQAEIDSMSRVFSQPTPWTLLLPTVILATTSNPVATIEVDPMRTKAIGAAIHMLEPQVFGGERQQKRFEERLSQSGILPAGMVTVPGEHMALDTYGNIAPGELMKMLSWLGSLYMGNRNLNNKRKNKTQRAGESYFVSSYGRSTLPSGIYKRVNGQPRMILKFVDRATYQVRLPWFETAQQTFDAVFDRKIRAELYQELGL